MVTRRNLTMCLALLVAAAVGCGAPPAGEKYTPDSQTLADALETDAVESDTAMPDVLPDTAADTADSSVPPDSTPDATAAGSGAKVYTYIPADPCAEEPAAPAEGSTCTTVDELRCSDFQQQSKLTMDLQTAGGTDMILTCKRSYVLRCEAAGSGMLWARHLAGDLAGSGVQDAASKAEGVWCLDGNGGPALEPGTCKGKYTHAACPKSAWGRRSCAGSSVIACGNASLIDAMLPDPLQSWHTTAKDALGDSFESCREFGRRYSPEKCAKRRLTCKVKDPETGETYWPSVPGNCVIDNDTGAHCATTCEEIGMEGPSKW